MVPGERHIRPPESSLRRGRRFVLADEDPERLREQATRQPDPCAMSCALKVSHAPYSASRYAVNASHSGIGSPIDAGSIRCD